MCPSYLLLRMIFLMDPWQVSKTSSCALTQQFACKYMEKTLKYYLSIFIFHFIEVLTPLILETQKQFNFTHIITGAGAFGKVK